MAQSKNEEPTPGDNPENQEGSYARNEYNGSGGIRYDDFIKKIKPDPKNKEQVILLYGYIGESTSEDRIRVYTDAGLTDYVEVAKAGILHSVPNDNDPLGGSRLWVKQASSNIQYSNASTYAQGDMYNDFMQNQFTPGQNFAGPVAGTAAAGITINTINSVICQQITNFLCPTRNILRCITPGGQRTICRPCFVTPQFETPQTPVVNPATPVAGGGAGFMNDPYTAGWGGDFTQGDMYNDFMQNQFTPGFENFGPGAGGVTSPFLCPVSIRIICPTQLFNCPTRLINCPTRFNCPSRVIICQSMVDACPTRFNCITLFQQQCLPVTIPTGTITDPTPTFGQVNEGTAGFAQGYDPYGYGDFTQGGLYNDYLQNQFTPETQGFAAAAQVPTPPQTQVIVCRPTLVPQLCPTNPIHPQCRPTNILNPLCQRTRIFVQCRTLNIVNCPTFGIVCPPPSFRCPF